MVDTASYRSPESLEVFGDRRSGRESLIDSECFFDGTFRTPGNMRIEGSFHGAIECQGSLFIAETGRVDARIVAGNLSVAGAFQGEAQCETRFELLKTGRVEGAITAKTTVIHDGAYIQGEIRMGGATQSASAPAASPPPARPIQPTPRASAANRAAPPPAATTDGESNSAAPADRVNGRSAPANGRDVLPDRTSEA